MKKYISMLFLFLLAIGPLILTAAASQSRAAEIPFSRTKIIIEFNASANDVGVQVLLDGQPWQKVKIESPNGRKLLDIISSGSLRKQGLTELFFESSEPSLDEVPLEEFLVRFPEGEYEFEGKTIDGLDLEGKATLTHAIPDGPSDVSAQLENGSLVISWVAPPKISSLTGLPINIVGYQVIVERTDALRTFDVKLPATATSVTVPPEFLEPGTEYKFEVLAIEESGNQTITEGDPFETQP